MRRTDGMPLNHSQIRPLMHCEEIFSRGYTGGLLRIDIK